MARTRKLFPIYGSTLANNMFTLLKSGSVVNGFVAAYVKEYERRGILGGPARDRELAETIGREAVLAMMLGTRDALPRFFGKKKFGALKKEELDAIDAFFREMMGALDRAWSWNAEDRRQFRRDLALYSDTVSRRSAPVKKGKRGGKLIQEESPFVGRVALLLDPSMLEQARRSARKFHRDVGLLAQKLLRQTLRPGR